VKRREATLVVGQSGGPTAVINATLVGVILAARQAGARRIVGLRHGVEGLLHGEVVDLSRLSPAYVRRLRHTPSALLGSCRYRLRPCDSERALASLAGLEASAFVYIGGNDSADTAHRIHLAALAAGYQLGVICAPKTIDNDLPRTDHCPGYGSAARFIAQCTAEAGLDTRTMQRTDPIKLIEVMGRHAGWLAAASWLGKRRDADAPHVVLLPERPQTPTRLWRSSRPATDSMGTAWSFYRRTSPGQTVSCSELARRHAGSTPSATHTTTARASTWPTCFASG
jgi:6-phosphofructokinase 1